jgi:Flp pilus assembly protein TadD
MIVRDEEKVLPRCLKSVQGVADELVVVDTGSNDNTISIAKDFGAKVSHLVNSPFKWCDDFAAARNESLKHAAGDWILQIDADEELLGDSIPHLERNILRSTVLQYVVVCDNGPKYPARRFAWIERLFRRHPYLRYHGPCHEGIYCDVRKLTIAEPRWQVEYESNIVICHHGYEPSQIRRKCERNLSIMKSYLKGHPNDDYILSKLGGTCYLLGHYDEAERCFGKALEIDPNSLEYNFDLGMTLQEQGKLDAAIKWYKRAIAVDPGFSEAYVNIGKIYIQKEMLDEATLELKRALAINPNSALGHSCLGLVYKDKGMLDESIAELRWALAIDPNLAEAHNNLGAVLYQQGKSEEAMKHFSEALRTDPDDRDVQYNFRMVSKLLEKSYKTSRNPETSNTSKTP